MAKYLLELAYTPDAWAAQLKNPQNRIEAVRGAVEKVGARIESAHYAFGDYDLVVIFEAPDNVTAAGLSLAFTSGGAIKAIKTTPLMSIDEGIAAMKRGAEAVSLYRPPSA